VGDEADYARRAELLRAWLRDEILVEEDRPGVYFYRYLNLARVHAKKAQQVTIRSDRPLPVHMDGELWPEPVQEIEVSLRPQALGVVT